MILCVSACGSLPRTNAFCSSVGLIYITEEERICTYDDGTPCLTDNTLLSIYKYDMAYERVCKR